MEDILLASITSAAFMILFIAAAIDSNRKEKTTSTIDTSNTITSKLKLNNEDNK